MRCLRLASATTAATRSENTGGATYGKRRSRGRRLLSSSSDDDDEDDDEDDEEDEDVGGDDDAVSDGERVRRFFSLRSMTPPSSWKRVSSVNGPKSRMARIQSEIRKVLTTPIRGKLLYKSITSL